MAAEEGAHPLLDLMPSICRAKNWIVICQCQQPAGSAVAGWLMDCHDSLYAGHLSVHKTLHNMQRMFRPSGMFSDMHEH